MHTMLDFLFPVFLGALKAGAPLSDRSLRIVTRVNRSDPTFLPAGLAADSMGSVSFMRSFASRGVYAAAELGDACFERLAVGAGGLGLHAYTNDYAIPGREQGAMARFRDRIYEAYGLTPPSRRSRAAAAAGQVHVLIVDQPRRPIINVDAVRGYVHAALPSANVTVVTWGRTSHNSVASPVASMAKMLQLLRTVDVQIAGPGSSHMNELLLGDGAVSIGYGTAALGPDGRCVPDLRGECIAGYLDDYMVPGLSYVKAFWKARYDVGNLRPGSLGVTLSAASVACLLRAAKTALSHEATIPTKPQDNQSPMGVAVAALLSSNHNILEVLRGGPCWAELRFPQEILRLTAEAARRCGLAPRDVHFLRERLQGANLACPCSEHG